MADASTCPHCGAHAVVVPDAELKLACGVCGAPRVALRVEGVALSGSERAPLEAAQSARKSRFLWRLGGAFAGLGGAFGLTTVGVMALLFSPGILWTGLGLALSLPFVLLAALAIGKAAARTDDLRRAVDLAWRAAAEDVVMASAGEITAKQLGAALAVDEAQAERLLTELAVDDDLRSRITDDGALAVAPAQPFKVRIDAGASGTAKTAIGQRDELEERFEALEEALAAEDQAAARGRAKSED